MIRRIWRAIAEVIRRYFVAGLLAFAPIAITFWALSWIIRVLDNLLLPRVLQWVLPSLETTPESPPLVGAIFTFVVILLAGVIARHFFGHEFVRLWERLLSRVPVARSIYAGVKQLFEAIFAGSARASFNQVVAVEYPRKGLYALAFSTGLSQGPLREIGENTRLVNCFVPTTPNPTSGFYLLIPEAEVHEVDLTVEEAFKVIMSAGLVTPEKASTSKEAEPAAVISAEAIR